MRLNRASFRSCQIKGLSEVLYQPSMGRAKGAHIRRIESAKAYGSSVVFRIVTAKNPDLSDLEEYGIYPLRHYDFVELLLSKTKVIPDKYG